MIPFVINVLFAWGVFNSLGQSTLNTPFVSGTLTDRILYGSLALGIVTVLLIQLYT